MACGDQALSLIVATDFVRGHRTSRLQNPSLPRMRCDEHRVPTELSWLEVAKPQLLSNAAMRRMRRSASLFANASVRVRA